MTDAAAPPVVEYRGYRLAAVFGRASPADVGDVVRMWIDGGVLPPAEAQRRVFELAVVVRAPDGTVAGVNTAYVADVPGGSGRFYFYRTYVKPEHRGISGLPTRMLRAALAALRDTEHPQAPRGVIVITENPKLMRRAAMARLEAEGLHLLGRDARGCDVWCLRFDGAVPVAPPGVLTPAGT
jgi:predicted GNAT family acetyltransferase